VGAGGGTDAGAAATRGGSDAGALAAGGGSDASGAAGCGFSVSGAGVLKNVAAALPVGSLPSEFSAYCITLTMMNAPAALVISALIRMIDTRERARTPDFSVIARASGDGMSGPSSTAGRDSRITSGSAGCVDSSVGVDSSPVGGDSSSIVGDGSPVGGGELGDARRGGGGGGERRPSAPGGGLMSRIEILPGGVRPT
jgi:hypothetical protein